MPRARFWRRSWTPPPPTAEEMRAWMIGNRAAAWHRYWKRTACPGWACWRIDHVFREHMPRPVAKATFARRVGWLGRVAERNRKRGRR
jgi:hypothetical protein